MKLRALDPFIDAPSGMTSSDRAFGRVAAAMANRTTRRTFLANAGRTAISLMGAGFITVWTSEAAFASCGGMHGEYPRATCMCKERYGSLNCPGCCSGYWVSCYTAVDNPASCRFKCLDTGYYYYTLSHLYDCCAKCSAQCKHSWPGCSRYGNDFCCNHGYCSDGCGSSSAGWRVQCVRKVCTSTICQGSCP